MHISLIFFTKLFLSHFAESVYLYFLLSIQLKIINRIEIKKPIKHIINIGIKIFGIIVKYINQNFDKT